MCTVLLPPGDNPVAVNKIYHNANFFFTIGVMDFLCEYGVNSPQTLQNNFGELTYLRDKTKTTQQTTHMLLLILIYKSTTCKLTLSHFV